MIIMKKVSVDSEKAVYKYLVEGNQRQYGVVEQSMDTSKIPIIVKSDGDSWQAYRNHAIRSIHSFVSEKNYPDQKTIAWY